MIQIKLFFNNFESVLYKIVFLNIKEIIVVAFVQELNISKKYFKYVKIFDT